MNSNKRPTSDTTKQTQPSWSSSKAILIGIVIDVGGSMVVGLLIGMVYAATLAASGLTPEQTQAALGSTPKFSFPALLMSISGLGLSVLSGFVATRKAQRSDFQLGMTLSAISNLVGFAIYFDPNTLAEDMALAALGFAAVIVGTYLGRVKPTA